MFEWFFYAEGKEGLGVNDNFTCIYKILRALEAGLDYPEFDTEQISYKILDISKERWSKYLEMMRDAGYINGVVIKTYITGETVVDTDDIRITLKGLEYLYENSIMQRLYKTAKGMKDVVPGL